MAHYRVVWEIDLDAEGFREAAETAREIQRDPDSSANVFRVIPVDPKGNRLLHGQALCIDLGDADPASA